MYLAHSHDSAALKAYLDEMKTHKIGVGTLRYTEDASGNTYLVMTDLVAMSDNWTTVDQASAALRTAYNDLGTPWGGMTETFMGSGHYGASSSTVWFATHLSPWTFSGKPFFLRIDH
jgi:hypothetical protein